MEQLGCGGKTKTALGERFYLHSQAQLNLQFGQHTRTVDEFVVHGALRPQRGSRKLQHCAQPWLGLTVIALLAAYAL